MAYIPTPGRGYRMADEEITSYLFNKIASALESAFKENKRQSVTLEIFSSGGNCMAGFAICRWIQANRILLQTVGYGRVDSMAVPLLLSAEVNRRFCTPECTFLLHPVANVYEAKTSKSVVALNQDIGEMKRVQKQYVDYVCGRVPSLTREKLNRLIKRGTRLSAEEALELGLVSEIIGN